MSRNWNYPLSRRRLLLLSGLTASGGALLGGLRQSDGDGQQTPRPTALVQQPSDGSQYSAVLPRGEIGRFQSADRAFRALFDELDGGAIYTDQGRYRLTSQLAVPPGFRVSNAPSGLFVNDLAENDKKCLTFGVDTGSDCLRVDCGTKDGVVLGEANTGSDIDIHYADIHRAGVDGAPRDALAIRGSGIKIVHVNIYQGTNGILLKGAYDVHILSSIITNAGTGLRLNGVENCFFDQMDFDSCRNYAVRIDGSSGVTLQGFVWNNPEFDAWPYRNVEIGVNRPCNTIYTDMKQLSNPGAALYVDEVQDSHLRHDISEADRSWFEYESGVTTTSRTADSCYIEGHIAPTVSNPVSNVEGGSFDLAGAGRISGTHTASGNGSTATFRIPHDLETRPDTVSVDPRSEAAAGPSYVSQVDSTGITVTYRSPPPSGTENLRWSFTVTV